MNESSFLNALKTYSGISDMLKSSSYDEILAQTSSILSIEPGKLEKHPMGGYSKWKTSGAYRFVVQDLIRNISHFDWLYEKLEDQQSKIVFYNQILFRLLPAKQFLKNCVIANVPQYFEKDIVHCNPNEVFVDCGGFDGETVGGYIKQYGIYKKIYVYEPSSENFAQCKKNVSNYSDVILKQCGVGERSTQLAISREGAASSFMGRNHISSDEKVSIISLDEDIQEDVTFIKMDIEGFEIPAILGAKHHIRNETPKLAICTYHVVSDLWEIPRLIHTIYSGYHFYLRHYDPVQNWETVLYAIPPKYMNPRGDI